MSVSIALDTFVCTCRDGYAIPTQGCTVDIDECTSNPCQNGALCYQGDNSFTCDCLDGWTGELCDAEVQLCWYWQQDCDVNAKCTYMGPGKHTCECRAGWRGDGYLCTDVSECDSSPCQNGPWIVEPQEWFISTNTTAFVPEYVQGEIGVDACPDGYEVVNNTESCGAAAQSIGLIYVEAQNKNLGESDPVCSQKYSIVPKIRIRTDTILIQGGSARRHCNVLRAIPRSHAAVGAISI